MSDTDIRTGRAVLQVYMHLIACPPGRAWSALAGVRRAGQAANLMSRISGHSEIATQALEGFAAFAQLDTHDLQGWVVPALAEEDVIEARYAPTGELLGIEERIGVTASVPEITARLFKRFIGSEVERCALDSAELAATTPLTERDHRDQLVQADHAECHHMQAMQLLASIGVLGRVRSSTLREDVVYSPHVWGSEAVDIAGFLHALPEAERTQLTGLTRETMMRPGLPLSKLGVPDNLLTGARKVGLVDGARVHTAGSERLFAFPPDLDKRLFGGRADVAHQRKLFTAHILNGHYFAPSTNGRINDPVLLVERLIERGSVGPATAIGREYPLLESAGIVRTRMAFGERRYLDLVQRDVAVDSLELIKRALDVNDGATDQQPLSSLWLPGTFTGPERDRITLDVTQASAEMELMTGAVLELREHLRRRNRGEELT
jgi:hypothetical protein